MKFGRVLVKRTVYLLGSVGVASLVACGGGDTDGGDGLQKYREQTVKWEACDPTILGHSSKGLDALWSGLGERLQCAHFSAPIDYANVGHGDVSVSVMRLSAGESAKRRGAMVFNPGGPGVDGLGSTFGLLGAFAGSNPASPLGAMNLRLLAEYDMVGFSPRGIGSSTRYECATTELERFVDGTAAGMNQENADNQNYNSRKAAEACRRNPVTPFINSDATARDMDLLRGLLGDEKLNYIGYSYGTWLGAWYAALFPGRVGRMVLDSAMDFSSSHEKATLLMPMARQRLLDKVLVPYAVRHADHFNLGNTENAVRAVMSALDTKVQGTLASSLSGAGYSRSQADGYLEFIAAARGLDEVLKEVPDPEDEDAIEQALLQKIFIPSDRAQDKVVRTKAEEIYTIFHSQWLDNQPSSIALTDQAVYWAVSCNDTPATTDLGVWGRMVQELSHLYPMFFSVVRGSECAFWGGPSVTKPGLDALQGLDILLVQSEYDSATPTEGANAFFSALPKARRVYVPTEYQHGVYPYLDTCVDSTVTSYLLGTSPAERQTVCPAQALAQDARQGQLKSGDALQKRSQDAAADTYKDPAEARERVRQFKEGLISPRDRR